MIENSTEVTSPDAFSPRRERVTVREGARVAVGAQVYRVTQVLDFTSVIAQDVTTGRSTALRILDLKPVESEPQGAAPQLDLGHYADSDWHTAQTRFAAIQPFLTRDTVGRGDIERRAAEVGSDPVTLYRWLRLYRTRGELTALIPQKRGWKSGKTRLPVHAEQVIDEVIRDYYLNVQRPTVQRTVVEVARRCGLRGITPPGATAIRARIARIAERESLRKRGFSEKARNKFTPVPGTFPNADYPLAVVQIDHTEADLIVVDDHYRKPIGRPWITLAIDVYSRMVTGYYLTLDHPSETSVALCVAHAVLPKQDWMIRMGVDADWPVWGLPTTIHVDNASEFRSDTLLVACKDYDIRLDFRPLGEPRYGGAVERAYRTFNEATHELPGTTFSSVPDREGYDSDKHAALTLGEFEKWLVKWICQVYHPRLHEGIGMSPLRKWNTALLGSADAPGLGLPPVPADPHTVLLDFMPVFWRTVQATGVSVEGLRYYSDALRPWIAASHPVTGTKKFIFRRDPRNISLLWFFDPRAKQYFRVPYANQALPPMSAWEHEQARLRLKAQGIDKPTDALILNALTELRAHVETSQERSRKARRQAQRRKEHERGVTPAQPVPERAVTLVPPPAGLLDEAVDVFGDIA